LRQLSLDQKIIASQEKATWSRPQMRTDTGRAQGTRTRVNPADDYPPGDSQLLRAAQPERRPIETAVNRGGEGPVPEPLGGSADAQMEDPELRKNRRSLRLALV
jgi:hypothetical protein